MLVLGVETSCDETGVAVYDSDRGLLAHNLYSQVKLHAEYGGVVPELASRDHVRKILPMLEQVLASADVTTADLDGIAYTAAPLKEHQHTHSTQHDTHVNSYTSDDCTTARMFVFFLKLKVLKNVQKKWKNIWYFTLVQFYRRDDYFYFYVYF